MIALNQAYEIAKKKLKEWHETISKYVWDDGEYYVFSTEEEFDEDPIAVNKNTGEIITYFPPEHTSEGKSLIKGKDF